MKTAKTLSWIIAVAGLWEIVAPFVFGMTATTAFLWDAIIVGLALPSSTSHLLHVYDAIIGWVVHLVFVQWHPWEACIILPKVHAENYGVLVDICRNVFVLFPLPSGTEQVV